MKKNFIRKVFSNIQKKKLMFRNYLIEIIFIIIFMIIVFPILFHCYRSLKLYINY